MRRGRVRPRISSFISASPRALDIADLRGIVVPPPEQSFWVNIIGRGYPPPNRTFRWCTQRMKIDPVTVFVQQRIGHWGEAILHLGARRAESSTRAQTMAGLETRNGLRRHPDLPRVWVSNPIEFLTTEREFAPGILWLVRIDDHPMQRLVSMRRTTL